MHSDFVHLMSTSKLILEDRRTARAVLSPALIYYYPLESEDLHTRVGCMGKERAPAWELTVRA